MQKRPLSRQGTWCRTTPAVVSNNPMRILLANLLQSSRSTFSWESFPSFFVFKEGMHDTQILALGGWPTVSDAFTPYSTSSRHHTAYTTPPALLGSPRGNTTSLRRALPVSLWRGDERERQELSRARFGRVFPSDGTAAPWHYSTP